MSQTPFDAYAEWFEALAPDLARELASALMQLFPGELLTPTLHTPDVTDGFVPRMRRLCTTPAKEVGLVRTVAALTEMAVLERGGTEDRTGAMLDVLEDVQETSGGDTADDALIEDWIDDQKMRQPLRYRQWRREYERWRVLRTGPLSPEQLMQYLRRKIMGLES